MRRSSKSAFAAASQLLDATGMGEAGTRAFHTASMRADLFRAREDARADWVVVSFTERCNRDLDGPGFGTEFLLREGFDVLAVRNAVDDWYMSIGDGEIAALNGILQPYERRGSYGSSMGAFAAIRFAKALGVQRSVAISPVLDIGQDWDTRYEVDRAIAARAGPWSPGQMIIPDHISPDTTYHVALDPFCGEDARHARNLAEVAPRRSIVRVPLGGHPVGPTMRDAGVLAKFVRNAILHNDTANIEVKQERNERFFTNLGRYLLARNKPRSVIVASTRALELAPEWGEAHLLHAQANHLLGRVDKVVLHGERAIALEPANPFVLAIVAQMLMHHGDRELAQKWVEAGVRRLGPEEVLLTTLRDLEH